MAVEQEVLIAEEFDAALLKQLQIRRDEAQAAIVRQNPVFGAGARAADRTSFDALSARFNSLRQPSVDLNIPQAVPPQSRPLAVPAVEQKPEQNPETKPTVETIDFLIAFQRVLESYIKTRQISAGNPIARVCVNFWRHGFKVSQANKRLEEARAFKQRVDRLIGLDVKAKATLQSAEASKNLYTEHSYPADEAAWRKHADQASDLRAQYNKDFRELIKDTRAHADPSIAGKGVLLATLKRVENMSETMGVGKEKCTLGYKGEFASREAMLTQLRNQLADYIAEREFWGNDGSGKCEVVFKKSEQGQIQRGADGNPTVDETATKVSWARKHLFKGFKRTSHVRKITEARALKERLDALIKHPAPAGFDHQYKQFWIGFKLKESISSGTLRRIIPQYQLAVKRRTDGIMREKGAYGSRGIGNVVGKETVNFMKVLPDLLPSARLQGLEKACQDLQKTLQAAQAAITGKKRPALQAALTEALNNIPGATEADESKAGSGPALTPDHIRERLEAYRVWISGNQFLGGAADTAASLEVLLQKHSLPKLQMEIVALRQFFTTEPLSYRKNLHPAREQAGRKRMVGFRTGREGVSEQVILRPGDAGGHDATEWKDNKAWRKAPGKNHPKKAPKNAFSEIGDQSTLNAASPAPIRTVPDLHGPVGEFPESKHLDGAPTRTLESNQLPTLAAEVSHRIQTTAVQPEAYIRQERMRLAQSAVYETQERESQRLRAALLARPDFRRTRVDLNEQGDTEMTALHEWQLVRDGVSRAWDDSKEMFVSRFDTEKQRLILKERLEVSRGYTKKSTEDTGSNPEEWHLSGSHHCKDEHELGQYEIDKLFHKHVVRSQKPHAPKDIKYPKFLKPHERFREKFQGADSTQRGRSAVEWLVAARDALENYRDDAKALKKRRYEAQTVYDENGRALIQKAHGYELFSRCFTSKTQDNLNAAETLLKTIEPLLDRGPAIALSQDEWIAVSTAITTAQTQAKGRDGSSRFKQLLKVMQDCKAQVGFRLTPYSVDDKLLLEKAQKAALPHTTLTRLKKGLPPREERPDGQRVPVGQRRVPVGQPMPFYQVNGLQQGEAAAGPAHAGAPAR